MLFCAGLLSPPVSRAIGNSRLARETLQEDIRQALAEFDEGLQIQSEHPQRARQLFRSSAQRFSSVVAVGVVNGPLEFNIGNCYMQAGDLGQAILHYRRALRLTPRDPMLAENLALARSRCLTAIKPAPGSAFIRNVLFWHYSTSRAERARAAVGFYALTWVCLILRQVGRRRLMFGWTIGGGAMTILLASSVVADHWMDRNVPDGVVTIMDVVVQKGPGQGYQRQFEQPLQAGVEFRLRERRGDWWKIELADRQTGWIHTSSSELVPTSSTIALSADAL